MCKNVVRVMRRLRGLKKAFGRWSGETLGEKGEVWYNVNKDVTNGLRPANSTNFYLYLII